MSTEKQQRTDYATGLQKESLDNSNVSTFSHFSHIKEDLTPTCNKISSYLNDFGYTTVQLIPTDVNAESKLVFYNISTVISFTDLFHSSISIFVLESWASRILTSIEELGDRLNNQKNAVKDAAVSKRLGEMTKDTLSTKIRELQNKLADTEKREKSLESKLKILGTFLSPLSFRPIH
jgi:hypothetical protein